MFPLEAKAASAEGAAFGVDVGGWNDGKLGVDDEGFAEDVGGAKENEGKEGGAGEESGSDDGKAGAPKLGIPVAKLETEFYRAENTSVMQLWSRPKHCSIHLRFLAVLQVLPCLSAWATLSYCKLGQQ